MGALIRALAVLVSAAAGVGVGFALYRYAPFGEAAAAPSPSTEHGAPSARPRAEVSAAPSASVALASASAPPVASASAAVAAAQPDEDPETCLPTLFAPGTFAKPPDLSAVCKGTKVREIAKRVKEAVVKGSGGHVSDGMQEWAVLGIHDIAAVAALRGRCCPSAPPLDVPPSPGACPPVADVLTEIEHAARAGAPDAELDAVVAHFDDAARCIVRSGDTAAFGGVTSLDGGETTMFQKILHRAQGGAAHP